MSVPSPPIPSHPLPSPLLSYLWWLWWTRGTHSLSRISLSNFSLNKYLLNILHMPGSEWETPYMVLSKSDWLVKSGDMWLIHEPIFCSIVSLASHLCLDRGHSWSDFVSCSIKAIALSTHQCAPSPLVKSEAKSPLLHPSFWSSLILSPCPKVPFLCWSKSQSPFRWITFRPAILMAVILVDFIGIVFFFLILFF